MKTKITILGISFLLYHLSYANIIANRIAFENSYSQKSNTISSLDISDAGYFIPHLRDLKDKNGEKILVNQIMYDSIVLEGDGYNFGNSVSSAGDVNGDGYSDIIVGSIHSGKAYIFFGGISFDNIADVIMIGEIPEGLFGISVSGAGDVNGDGYSDVIIGAYGFSSYSFIGKALIYFGASNMDNIVDVSMIGEAERSYFGYSVSSAGDVNNDGYSDVIIGAPSYNSNTGRSYIFYGGVNMNNVADVIITGDNTENYFGISVASVEDVNSDGYSDVVVGENHNYPNTGKAYLFYGGKNMNNIADVVFTGETNDNYFGLPVSSAGDVNGDGYSDVIIGDYGFSSNTGRVYLYYGGINMDNIADVTLTGENINNYFNNCSCVGDFNKDGYSDIIVGAWGYNSNSGRTYIYYGGLNMDNIADEIMTGENVGDGFGISVSSAGDVNGDGITEVLIGAFNYNSGSGRAYLYFKIIPVLLNPLNNSTNNPLSICFKWNMFVSTTFYILHVSTDSMFNFILINDTIFIDTFKTISGFQKDKKYYWRIIAMDSSGDFHFSSIWNFKTISYLKLSVKILMEGMYFPIFNQLTRKDTVKIYLCNSISPYNKLDSSIESVDSLSFIGLYQFQNAPPGTYYIVAKHFNCIETWSKTGGEPLTNDGSIYNYDFTTSASQAYGNNLKRKGTKYCMFSGDINFDGVIDGSDAIRVHSDSFIFLTGNYLPTDLNGDGVVDGSDYSIVDNNAFNFVVAISP